MANQTYHPEADYPGFWELVERAGSTDQQWKSELAKLTKEEFLAFGNAWLQAQIELQGEFEDLGYGDHSEDALEDLADGILAAGRQSYFDAYEGRREIDVEEEQSNSKFHCLCEVFYDRFGENLYDHLSE